MRRVYLILGGLALLWGAILAVVIRQPGYTDAYYYFNAGQRLAQGDGLTDATLWIYINAPDSLPGPSHVYWMPLESLVAAASMALFGATFGAAQLPSVLCFAGLVLVAAWVGAHLGVNPWVAGLLVLFSGFFTPFWATTDTFALYGLVGSLALLTMGRGRATGDSRWYALSGALGALAHLTRADGVLLVLVMLLVIVWPGEARRPVGRYAAAGILAYLLVMLPWMARNLNAIGTPLPAGGISAVWLRGYEDIANYPPGVSASEFWAWGLDNILRSRWTALTSNIGTFIAVETWIVLGPFVLAGLWSRRRDPLLLGVILYAAGMHLAMTFVFAYPGYRGGLFHSSAALLPFWAAAGLIGLRDGIAWMSKRRRWRKQQAQMVFSGALVALAVVLSVGVAASKLSGWNDNGDFYRALAHDLPDGAVVMVNDPPALYYHTGLSGVVVPNADPSVVPEIAARYGVTYLVLDPNRTRPFAALFAGEESYSFLRLIAQYGTETEDPSDDRRVYAIVRQE